MPVLYCHVMDTFSQKSEPNLDLFICYLNWMRVAWFVLLCELNHCACWRIEFSSLILTECYGASDLLTFLVFACLWTNADHLCVIASMRYGRMLYCMCVSYLLTAASNKTVNYLHCRHVGFGIAGCRCWKNAGHARRRHTSWMPYDWCLFEWNKQNGFLFIFSGCDKMS